MARVTLGFAGEDVIVGGSDITVVGTAAGGEVITVISGNIRLDPSFNVGGDTVILPGAASDYTAYRAGGEVVLTRNDSGVTIRIPVGTAGIEVEFNGGDSRTLLFNQSTGQATIEGQVISTSPTAQTALTPSGPAPLVGYDVVGANATVVEGDNGQRLLVFTISLDRAVLATDGPVTLNYQTQNGTADSATDYVAAAGTVTFAVGQQVATVSVVVNGDLTPEASETLSLLLTGARLRNGPETLTGTITNDDTQIVLTTASDNLLGSSGRDQFFAANTALGAGDKITDVTSGDNDLFTLAVDATTGNRNYGGFRLEGIENIAVTNDSGKSVTLDLSSSSGITSVSSSNSSDTVVFDQLTSLASVIVDDVTGTTADIVAIYQQAVTAGANDTVNVIVNDATADEIILSTVGAGNVGIENVTLSVSGTSTINAINTALTALTINGGGNVTIDSALNTSVRSVNASGAGNVDIDFSNTDVGTGVTYTGSNLVDIVASGSANDIITTGSGNDVVTDEGGNDTIDTGSGNDTVSLLGAGNVNIVLGTGNDSVSFAAGQFNGSDKIDFGADNDTLVLSQSSVESDYANFAAGTLENLTIATSATTNLGINGGGSSGELAGIRTVNLNTGGNGGPNDVLIANDYTAGLTVNLGGVAGTDSVLLGSGNDVINTSSFDNSDVLQGNGGVDTLNVQDGALSIDGTSSFSGIEAINILSDGDGDDQVVAIDNDNGPTSGNTLTFNAGNNTSGEFVAFNSGAVTAYSVVVTTGAANDTIVTNNNVADTVNAGAGNDSVTIAGGDTVFAGSGTDSIFIGAGNNIVNGEGDNDSFNISGAGSNKLSGGAGDDLFFVAFPATNLDATDILDGGDGTDTLDTFDVLADAQLTGLSNVEVLQAGLGSQGLFTIGAEAQEGGIRTVIFTSNGPDSLDASKFTVGLTVNSSGGNDTITTGSGADVINVGVGSYNITTNDGDDQIRVSGNELDATDKIAGGVGNDSIILDNSAGTVTGTADLATITGIENYTVLASGDLGSGVDANANVLTFTSSVTDVVTSVTPVNINAGALTDVDDSFTVVIANSVADSDFTLNVTGGATTTIVDKQNVGINNNINFTGGTGADILRVAGSDAGSTVVFIGGNGANDTIVQTGASILTDDGFIGLQQVEVLSADTAIFAVLGSRAAGAGINRIEGTNNNDVATIGAGFTTALTVNIGAGNDQINGSLSSAAITFNSAAANYTSADILSGGSTVNDVVNIGAGGTADLANVTRIETINVNNSSTGAEATIINLGLTAAQVDGALLTVNVNGSDAADTLTFNGGTVTENVRVNGGAGADTITTGSGNDAVFGNGGVDTIALGGGNDTADGGAGNDTIRGQAGNDTLDGGDNDDILYGDVAFSDVPQGAFPTQLAAYNASGAGNDILNGGSGNDVIVGGLGRDTLTGGAGSDTFRYYAVEDSRFLQSSGAPVDNRDIITAYEAGVDRIDLNALLGAQSLRFNGDFATYAEAQAAVGGTAGDGFVDVAFVRNLGGQSILFVDVDNNGQLDGNDLQIILQNVSGTLTATDFGAGIPAPLVEFAPQVQTFDQVETISLRFDNNFDSLQFA